MNLFFRARHASWRRNFTFTRTQTYDTYARQAALFFAPPSNMQALATSASLKRRVAANYTLPEAAASSPRETNFGRTRRRIDHFFALNLKVILIAIILSTVSSGSRAQQLEDAASSSLSLELEEELGGANPLSLAQQSAQSSATGDKPRLIPLVAAESGYSENSSVNVLCTVSQGHHESLTFDWFKDGQLLLGSASDNQQQQQAALISDEFSQPSRSNAFSNSNLAPQIEKHSDHSLLRIARVQSQHSGRYTCAVKNQFGQDSSSVHLIVNGN